MEQLVAYKKSYQEYKAELDGVMQSTAEGFVKIGYLLKVARDTDILRESGYATVAEFAQAEYGIDKTQTSRFISINDRFSEGGYADHLIPEYQGFGFKKLTIMLQLPDVINEELTPAYTAAEIKDIQDEYNEEAKVTDIECMLEQGQQDEEGSTLEKAILQLGEDDPELYVSISDRKDEYLESILPEIMAPAGDKIYSVHVAGIGGLMITISEVSDTIKVVNTRSGEKETFTWHDMALAWTRAGVLGSATEHQDGKTCWEQRYERKYPVKEVEVAPVQLQEKKPKKESKVQKAPDRKKDVINEPEDVTDRAEIVTEDIPEAAGENIFRKTIEKKILPQFFREIMKGNKTFEIRKDEDDAQPGDTLILREWDDDIDKYSGRSEKVEISYVLRDAEEYGLMPGYCIMCWRY